MVFQFAPGTYRGKNCMVNRGLDYYHCKGCLRCVEVCPKEALIRRESDGIVFIREEACVGCGACQKACPHHLIWVDPRKRKSVKCDQCKDRLDAGLDTACVTVCPTGALKLVRKERPGR